MKRISSGYPSTFSGSTTPFLAAVAALLLFSACHFEINNTQTYDNFSTITIPVGFDFATSRIVGFELNVKQYNDSQELVPYANGVVQVLYQDDTGDHILGAGTTDISGDTTFDVVVPTSVTSVAIRPERNILVEYDQSLPPALQSVRLNLSPGFAEPMAASERSAFAAFDKAVALPIIPFRSVNGYLSLFAFETTLGVPTSGLTSRTPAFKQTFINDVGATFPDKKKVSDTNPEYLTVGDKSNTILTKDAAVSVTFVSETAGYKNVLGYFVYKTGSAPTAAVAKNQIVIIFPNASAVGSGGGLKCGDTVALRNPVKTINGVANPYYQTTMFNSGYTISWTVLPDAFRNTEISESQKRFYSLWPLNPETGTQIDKAHAALLLYDHAPYSDKTSATPDTGDDAIFLLGFEDQNRKIADGDFNDVLFSVQSTPFDAVDRTGIPLAKQLTPTDTDLDGVIDLYDEYPTDNQRSSSVTYPSATTYGTAMFEDLWPSIGDFDFNDLVTDYRFKTVANAKGEAVELIAEFKIRAAGGDNASGLAFTLPVASSYISGVTYATASAQWKIQGGLKPFSPEAIIGVERNGANSVSVPVFTSAHDMFGLAAGADRIVNTKNDSIHKPAAMITVKVSFMPGLASSRISGAPLDIFLVALAEGLRKEIHTIRNFPTVLVAGSIPLFGTADDNSPIGPLTTGLYYRSKATTKSSAGAPWGLIMPASTKYPVEKSELALCYRHFGEWVTSNGASYADWYDSTKAGYVNTTFLYNKE